MTLLAAVIYGDEVVLAADGQCTITEADGVPDGFPKIATVPPTSVIGRSPNNQGSSLCSATEAPPSRPTSNQRNARIGAVR